VSLLIEGIFDIVVEHLFVPMPMKAVDILLPIPVTVAFSLVVGSVGSITVLSSEDKPRGFSPLVVDVWHAFSCLFNKLKSCFPPLFWSTFKKLQIF
jgi:hypothetical protein